jgi:hypothetical protein
MTLFMELSKWKNMRGRSTCLYSAASTLERSLSAASQSFASNPTFAELLFFDGFVDLPRVIQEAQF